MAFNPVTLILFFLSLIPGATLTPRTCDPSFRGPGLTTYDVFLSFRGGDTRQHFTDHLYKALTRAGIPTFRDDDEIGIGENIELEIQKAVQESKSSIIVFSKNYSSSRWCLDELLMIMERRRTVGHLVFPVFYDVDPSEVENQTGQFGEEFAKLEVRFKYQMERVEGWRRALKEAANMERMVLEDRYSLFLLISSKFVSLIAYIFESAEHLGMRNLTSIVRYSNMAKIFNFRL